MTVSPETLPRCDWANEHPLLAAYHDAEWGVHPPDDRGLFEMLVLSSFQAGLSWLLVLQKRDRLRQVFHNFEPAQVARFDQTDIDRLLADPGIIRNRGKIQAAVSNARAVLQVQAEFGSFDAYLWQFTGGRVLRAADGPWRPFSPESEAMARDMKRRGFKFVGKTICYAYMQSIGLVNDHARDCFRFRELWEES